MPAAFFVSSSLEMLPRTQDHGCRLSRITVGRIRRKIAYRRDGRTRGPFNLLRRAAFKSGDLLMRAGSFLVSFGLRLPDRNGIMQKTELAYEDRVASEIHRFNKDTDVHALPEIFHYWSNRFLRPKLEQVMEATTPEEFYLNYIGRIAREHSARTIRVASLGAGNADTELRIARELVQAGVRNFRMDCLDLNAMMLQRGKDMAGKMGLTEYLGFQQIDLSDWHPAEKYDVVIANQVLHHIVPLEAIFENVFAAIGEHGYFLSCDTIGRNGHMRWPETLSIVQELWRELPDRYRYNNLLKRYEEVYDNWDCSRQGFEGIRAQDILPLLVKKFQFERFVAYGGLPDIFVDRAFGHNFNASDEQDLAFIERVGAMNDRLIDEGAIKPTQMIAAMRAVPCAEPRFHKHWTPEFCVRLP